MTTAALLHRQRVLAALNHQPPDRMPVDFGGHRSSGMAATLYPKLRHALGLEPRPVRVYDPVQQLAIIDEDVLDRLGVDTIELGRGFALQEQDWAEWVLPDGAPCLMPAWVRPERQPGQWVIRSKTGRVLARMPDGALYFEQCYWPFLEEEHLGRLEEALDDQMWGAVQAPPGPLVAGRRVTGSWPKAPGNCAAAPSVLSSGCLAATCWKPGSSSTASTAF